METVFMQKYIDILVIENRIGLSSVQKRCLYQSDYQLINKNTNLKLFGNHN